MIQSSPSIQSETSFSSVAQVITKSFDSKHTQVCNVSSFPNICQLTYSQSRYYAQSPRKKTVASPCSHSTACHQSSSRGVAHEYLAYSGPDTEEGVEAYDQLGITTKQLCNFSHPFTQDLLALDACRSSTLGELPESVSQITTPMRADRWEAALRHHPDQQFSHYICHGIRTGFRIGFDRTKCTPASTERNMMSASHHPQPVQEYLAREIEAGRVVPLANRPAGLIVSRLGVIPKRDQDNQWRLILDLSHPPNHSINDGVSKELSSLTYASVDDAVRNILRLGQGTLLAKCDIKQAYSASK